MVQLNIAAISKETSLFAKLIECWNITVIVNIKTWSIAYSFYKYSAACKHRAKLKGHALKTERVKSALADLSTG